MMEKDNSRNSKDIKCIDCGEQFTFSAKEQAYFEKHNLATPKRCKSCRKKRKQARIKAEREREERAWQELKEKEWQLFEEKLSEHNQAEICDIKTTANTLFIIGNGFDLMHGVPSTYRDFEKTVGGSLRFCLETYLDVEDIWADFEDALGHLDVSMMMNTEVLNMWLEDFGAYDPDAQAADFFAAVETAINPAFEIPQELPKAFRRWVDKLKCDTTERPLKGLLNGEGRFLNFNYTEFIEDLYGVPHDHVCYIHGCRVKIKYKPKDKLILGHKPGIEDEEWDKVRINTPKFKSQRKRELFEAAVETAGPEINWYYDDMTKKCSDIIEGHKHFFNDLKDITEIVTVGHSLSKVDWDYFGEIAKQISKPHWYFGCHGLWDLLNMEALTEYLGIDKTDYTVVRM